ncbi:MAG TPA: DUF4167 domain-containing protein [Xanthobacteraceae bacterium]|nr:DUF4167 domain-containing protein [Xanthobacteraceae bacterium]
MRNGQNNKRMRSRNTGNNNNRRGQNPLTRVFESNGPDIKIRGTASHIAEKYVQLARDARSSGDPVAAENYYQHAEHYFRLIASAQEQFRQNQPQQGRNDVDLRDDAGDEGEGDGFSTFGAEPGFVPAHQPQVYQRETPQPREHRPQPAYQPREQQPQPQYQQQPQPQLQPSIQADDVDRLPSFITGAPQPQSAAGDSPARPAGDRYPPRRRRRPPAARAAAGQDAPAPVTEEAAPGE